MVFSDESSKGQRQAGRVKVNRVLDAPFKRAVPPVPVVELEIQFEFGITIFQGDYRGKVKRYLENRTRFGSLIVGYIQFPTICF